MFNTNISKVQLLIKEARDFKNRGYKSSAKARLAIAKMMIAMEIHEINQELK